MNITTSSPALVLFYVCALIWILMGVDMKSLPTRNRRLIFCAVLLLGVANDLLRKFVGAEIYGKLLVLCMHLPVFFLFLFVAKRGSVKTLFMILTAVVFTAPTILIGNMVRRVLFVDSAKALLLANLISYAVMLLLTWMVFRRGFNYLMIHGDTRFFLMFSCLPIIYYVYMLASVNLDFSAFSSVRGYIVRLIPSIEVLAFYFLIPYIYESLREKILMQSAQDALTQELSSAQTQIDLLNETNTQTAVYRHDMRHQLVMLDGLLTSGETRQAQEYLKTVITDLDTITPKRFCENQTVNLLCSSYESKAKRQGVELKINAVLPKEMPLSDTELCSLISNGLENALHAASSPEVREKWVEVYCNIKQNKVFIQIRNPYSGDVTMKDGRPVSQREDHGFGCYSIQTITQRNNGLCSFEAKDGLFTLRLAFLLPEETDATV